MATTTPVATPVTTTAPAAPAPAPAVRVPRVLPAGPLRLLITGATGNTGLELVKQSLQMGHHVTVIVRKAEKLKPLQHERLRIMIGNALEGKDIIRVIDTIRNDTKAAAPATPLPSTSEVKTDSTSATPAPSSAAAAVVGAPFDAALCALGVASVSDMWKGTPVEVPGTRALIDACNHYGIDRLIVVSSNGVGDSNAYAPWIVRPLWRKMFQQKDAQENMIRACTGIDWVIVRPTALLNDKPKGLDKIFAIQPGKLVSRFIGRADVASFCLAQLTSNQYVGQWPSICWKK